MANVQTQVLSDDAANDALLAELLSDVGLDAGGDEVIETVPESDGLGQVGDIAASVEMLDDSLLEEIDASAKRTDDMQALYAEQPAQPAIAAGETAPETTPEIAAAAPKKKRSGGKKKEAKAPAEDESAPAEAPAVAVAPVEDKKPKVPRATSVTHKPGDLLLAKLGDKADDFLVFDSTADLAQIEVDKIQFIERMNDRDAIADKVREKINMFLVWMAKGGSLNEVLKRAITVLHTDGQLTSGDKGNLQLNLLSKPYSVGTARSQANQMFMALPELGLTIKEKGRMIPNPNSPLLVGAYAALGLE
ncbi:hypothetical protein [Duganella sp. FT27W]|uniref:hypothetical protein n=1 Tax=Duganella sp. FT27W TaxID=2654636 RepID=UPI00128C4B48|nr:hypothetical protein [Duganella sp. FT27W]MPQ56248.1 hypothetical protein [Duganella sp. FT27W]